jgi:hypothetical protein
MTPSLKDRTTKTLPANAPEGLPQASPLRTYQLDYVDQSGNLSSLPRTAVAAGQRGRQDPTRGTSADGTARTVALTAADGHVELVESEVADPDARVIGTEDEWIEALSPLGSLTSLTVTGQYSIVELLLADLVPTSAKAKHRRSA